MEVVTVWAPRPDHPKWQNYLPLLDLQIKTAKRAGHHHRVVTDAELHGYTKLHVDLPKPLLRAIVTAQLAYMKQWDASHRVVLLDVDCMVVRNLHPAFTGFDVGLTIRDHPTQPVQNGVMFFEATQKAKAAAIEMLERTLEICGTQWGEDQEALAQVVDSPGRPGREIRFGAQFEFIHIERHNHADKSNPRRRLSRLVFIEHFKGDTKHQAADYVERLFRA